MLEHTTQPDVLRYLGELKAASALGVRYLIGTNSLVPSNNVAAQKTGGYTPINFHLEPFSFRRGILEWQETPDNLDTGTTFCEIWPLTYLPQSLPSP